MKKLTLTLALLLCLVLCAFAFASCDKKGKAAATTTASGCAHVWGDYVVDLEPTCSDAGVKSKYCTKCGAQDPASVAAVDPLPHTEGTEYKIDTPATCSAVGWESKHCTVCGAIISSTVRQIDINEKAHDVDKWTVTDQATMFNQTGERTGICKLCKKTVKEELKYEPTVKACTSTNGGTYKAAEFGILEAQGDKHFYATDTEPANDLFIEFSILWNPTMLNLNGQVSNPGPYCATRIEGGGTTNLTYWSGTDSPKGSWCPYAGGFEGAALTEGSPAGMMKENGDYAEYPNIGGSVARADANNLDNGHEWGWHRVGVRVHQEVTNLAALKADTTPGATAPEYKITVTVYFDGDEAFSVYGDLKSDKVANRLYSVASNGDGTVTYTEIGSNIKAIPFVINTTGVKSNTTAYIVTADHSVTCGNAFVLNVVRVDNPTAATYQVADGVNLNAPVYFKLAD